MFASRLFLKLFCSMILLITVLSAAVYLLTVPPIEQETYRIELEASRTILDNVFKIAEKVAGSLQEQRALTVESVKSELKTVVKLAASYIDTVYAQVARGEIDNDQARQIISGALRTFRYGNNGYVWVVNYNSVFISHPDPTIDGTNVSALRDENSGQSIIPTIVEIARGQGEGFHEYAWNRLGSKNPAQKISYFLDLPRQGLIVGTGAYLDDIDEAVERRKSEAIEQLRLALSDIRIAKTGYIFAFDDDENMLIHPNPNIQGMKFSERIDMASKLPISVILKAAADSDAPASYLWDKPADAGNYTYPKISWVRHFKGFNWYIASSVYVDELQSSARGLRDRIFSVSVAIMAIVSLLGSFAIWRIVDPLQKLATVAENVTAGKMDVASGISRRDEIGTLAQAFDAMIGRIRGDMQTLESRVKHRTSELEATNVQLVHAMREGEISQSALTEAEARQRLVLDAMPAAIAYLDRELHIRFVNSRWCEWLTTSAERLLGKPIERVIGHAIRTTLSPYIRKALQGESVRFDYLLTGVDGNQRLTQNTIIPQLSADANIIGLFVLSQDVTDARAADQRMQEVHRLTAVGQLAGGLAHDFNNLLSVILGNLATAKEKFSSVEKLDSYLEPAQRAGRRAGEIADRLLAYSRRQPHKESLVDVRQSIQETSLLLERSLPSNIRMNLERVNSECWLSTDACQFENMLVNLALNAQDAMPNGGRLEIRASNRVVSEGLALDELVELGEYIEIVVQDSGAGFAPTSLSRAFEPFFTTKLRGSGLGLTMVYGFIKKSRGYIRIESAALQGTTVTILLPSTRQEGSELGMSTVTTDTKPWKGYVAVLAENDDEIRGRMRVQLVKLGFAVLEADTGSEASRIIDHIDHIDLLVSEVEIPGLSGMELAQHVSDSHPSACIVLTSSGMRPLVAAHNYFRIQKPFDASSFSHAIENVMDNKKKSAEPHTGGNPTWKHGSASMS